MFPFLLLIMALTPLVSHSDIPKVYNTLSSLEKPTRLDYLKIQLYIQSKERKDLQPLDRAIAPGGVLQDYRCRSKRFRMVGKYPWQNPKFAIIPYQCSLDDKRFCIVTYASYNQNYPKGVFLLEKKLQEIGFQGHFVYRIGGFPDLDGGSLKLAHIPYSFKPSFLRELKRRGYQNVLWLDSSIRPLKDLQHIFSKIESQGYLFYPSGHTLEKYCSPEAIAALGEPLEKAFSIPSVAAGVFGVNLSHPVGLAIAEKWYRAALQKTPFLSPRPEQNALSILLYQMGIVTFQPPDTLAWSPDSIDENAEFLVDWSSIQPVSR